MARFIAVSSRTVARYRRHGTDSGISYEQPLEVSSESLFGKPVPFAIGSEFRPSPEGEGDNCTMWTGLLTALRNEL